MTSFRTGIGYDVHKLVEGRPFIMGGVNIPHEKGLLGHSDADCLLHALCDALLGAAALGDIGEHFSDKDPRWKGTDSKIFLTEVVRLVSQKGYKPNNVDAVIIAEAPKMAPHKQEMRRVIAQILGLTLDDVNVKATTEEGLGFTGKKEGVAAWAVVMIQKI